MKLGLSSEQDERSWSMVREVDSIGMRLRVTAHQLTTDSQYSTHVDVKGKGLSWSHDLEKTRKAVPGDMTASELT